MSEIAVVDTHALVWYTRGEIRRLGRQAKKIFHEVEARRAVLYVPVLVLIEISEMARRGEVSFPHGFRAWVDQILRRPGFVAVDLTLDVVTAAEALYSIPERGDRLIAATAAHYGVPVVTRDPRIGAAAGVEVIW